MCKSSTCSSLAALCDRCHQAERGHLLPTRSLVGALPGAALWGLALPEEGERPPRTASLPPVRGEPLPAPRPPCRGLRRRYLSLSGSECPRGTEPAGPLTPPCTPSVTQSRARLRGRVGGIAPRDARSPGPVPEERAPPPAHPGCPLGAVGARLALIGAAGSPLRGGGGELSPAGVVSPFPVRAHWLDGAAAGRGQRPRGLRPAPIETYRRGTRARRNPRRRWQQPAAALGAALRGAAGPRRAGGAAPCSTRRRARLRRRPWASASRCTRPRRCCSPRTPRPSTSRTSWAAAPPPRRPPTPCPPRRRRRCRRPTPPSPAWWPRTGPPSTSRPPSTRPSPITSPPPTAPALTPGPSTPFPAPSATIRTH